MTEIGLSRNLPGTRKSRNGTRYQNQEVENSSKPVPYREPGTEPGSSGLNFLGGPRSNWFNRDVTGFLQEITVFLPRKKLKYNVLNVFLDVHLYLRLKNHIDVFLDVLNIVLDVVLGIDIEVTLKLTLMFILTLPLMSPFILMFISTFTSDVDLDVVLDVVLIVFRLCP